MRTRQSGCDVLDTDASLVQSVEHLELVGGVHVLAPYVFGQARLGPVRAVRVQHAVGNGGALGNELLLGQQFEGGQSAPAGDNLAAVTRLPFAVQLRPDHKGLQQPMCLDGCGQGLDPRTGSGAPDVGRAGQGISLARLMSVVVVVTVLVIMALSLSLLRSSGSLLPGAA